MRFLTLLVLLTSLSICPEPVQEKISGTQYFPLKRITISCPDKSAGRWAARHLYEWYGNHAPRAVMAEKSDSQADVASQKPSDEGYTLRADRDGVRITATSLQGVRYALYSLRQIAIPKRGTMKVEGWIVPACDITDRPSLPFRGIHICWFHETQSWEIERLIRLAAYYKLNYAVIEPWGTYSPESAPWLGWSDAAMTKDEIRRLREIASDLGITLIPQFNMLGHASGARVRSAKHAAIDISPEYQPLFEPEGGWNWCISNPRTRKLLLGVMKEMLADFGNPPYFHIGFDEAEPPSCPECLGRPYEELMLEHLESIVDLLHRKGATPMMWHDMLLNKDDPRWKGFKAGGNSGTAEMAKNLPCDIVICDWYYKMPQSDYPTLRHFKSLGHPTLTCPWDKPEGIRSQARAALEYGIQGILGTLWHHYWGKDMENIFTTLAHSAWNPLAEVEARRLVFATHLRQIGWDMKNTQPRNAGTYYFDIAPQSAY